MFRIRFLLACVVALVATGALVAAFRPVPETAARFLTDASGRALVLHGFSASNSAKSTPDGLPLLTEEEVAAEYEDMGTNFVRLLISWRAVEPSPGVYDEEYFDGLEEILQWYADRDYAVMLDMHQDLWGAFGPYGEGQVGNGAPQWATHTDGKAIKERDQWELHYLDPGVVRAFDHFWGNTSGHPELMDHYAGAWQAVAQRFAGHEAVVAYDLMNESYGGSTQGPVFEAGALTELYQRTTAAIREVDDATWVCIEPQVVGFNWGLPSALRPIEDPADRIAFCPHLYPHPLDLGEDYTGSDAAMVDKVIAGWINNTLHASARLGDAPIILGEFGLDTERPGALDFVEKVLTDMGEAGISTAYWSRDDGTWGPYDADKQPRNLVEVLNRPYPRAVAGTPIRWGTEEGVFTLEMVPDPALSAPTELYLPPDRYVDPVVFGGELVSWDDTSGRLQVRVEGEDPVTVRVRSTGETA